MEIKGEIIAVLPMRSGTSANGKTWQTQEYVLQTIDAYPKRVCFEVFGDKIQKLNISMGEELTVQFDIDAHEYNGRWFNSIKCWNINRQAQTQAYAPKPQSAVPNAQPYQPQPFAPRPTQAAAPQQPTDDGLPF